MARILTLAFAFPLLAQAQTYKALYSFTGAGSGANPEAGLIRDSAGNLYGTTFFGGNMHGCDFAGCGVVFKLNTADDEMVLLSFAQGTGGIGPEGGVIRDSAGNLYGTTFLGGDMTACAGNGCGIVFKLDTAGKETVLYRFKGGKDGANPFAGLIQDGAGNLYGTTYDGGIGPCVSNFGGCGVVFKLDTTGKETVLHSFTGGKDGANPQGGLIRDAAGNLYGTATQGGTSNNGVVFKLNSAGKETVLHSFAGPPKDGRVPEGGVVRDSIGNLYGTTIGGGAFQLGTVFEVTVPGKETVLHSFTGGGDGEFPAAGLVRDAADNLYGTTSSGGVSGGGTVFKLDGNRKKTLLYSFTGGVDGGSPYAPLILDGAGNLYGTAADGGDSLGGVVFKLTP